MIGIALGTRARCCARFIARTNSSLNIHGRSPLSCGAPSNINSAITGFIHALHGVTFRVGKRINELSKTSFAGHSSKMSDYRITASSTIYPFLFTEDRMSVVRVRVKFPSFMVSRIKVPMFYVFAKYDVVCLAY